METVDFFSLQFSSSLDVTLFSKFVTQQLGNWLTNI